MDAGCITILSQKAAARAKEERAASSAAAAKEGTTATEAGATTAMNKDLRIAQEGTSVTMTREALIQKTCEAVASKDFVPMQSVFSMQSW
jgi:hypothetical protein